MNIFFWQFNQRWQSKQVSKSKTDGSKTSGRFQTKQQDRYRWPEHKWMTMTTSQTGKVKGPVSRWYTGKTDDIMRGRCLSRWGWFGNVRGGQDWWVGPWGIWWRMAGRESSTWNAGWDLVTWDASRVCDRRLTEQIKTTEAAVVTEREAGSSCETKQRNTSLSAGTFINRKLDFPDMMTSFLAALKAKYSPTSSSKWLTSSACTVLINRSFLWFFLQLLSHSLRCLFDWSDSSLSSAGTRLPALIASLAETKIRRNFLAPAESGSPQKDLFWEASLSSNVLQAFTHSHTGTNVYRQTPAIPTVSDSEWVCVIARGGRFYSLWSPG